jgi:hypothetical protein
MKNNSAYLQEINRRILACMRYEAKLEYLDELLKKKEINSLEYHLFKQAILGHKDEETVRKEIDEYIWKAMQLRREVSSQLRTASVKSAFSCACLILIFLGIFSFLRSPVYTGSAVIEFDGNSSTNGSSVSSLNWSHTVGTGANRILLVGTGTRNDAAQRNATNITYGGIALTKIAQQDRNGFGNLALSELWYLVNPPSGTAVINVTFSGSAGSARAGAISLNNVNQTSPLGTLAQSGGCPASPQNLNIVTATNNSLIVDIIGSQDGGFTVGSGQIERWQATTGGQSSAMSTRNTTTNGTYTMSWTISGCIAHIAQEIVLLPSSPPAVTTASLNSTFGTNITDENLTISFSSFDPDGDNITNITDWRIGDTSIAVLNMPFENYSNAMNNITDYSTINNTGSFNSGLIIRNGKVGSAIELTSTKYVTITDRDEYSPALQPDFSVETWVNFTTTTGSQSYLMKAGSGEFEWGLEYYDNTARLTAYTWNSDGFTRCGAWSGVTPTIGTWHHIVGTFENITDTNFECKIYVDGVLKATNTETGAVTMSNTASPIIFGRRSDGSNVFAGQLDQVLIYNRTLSAEEILRHNLTDYNIIVSQETKAGERWSAAVTSNDGMADSTTVISNNVTIRNIINITSIYPNQTGQVQNITSETSVAITRDSSATTNLTFNATAIAADSEMLTFSWYINNILRYAQNILSGSTSLFSNLFATAGTFNVTVVVNGSDPATNDTFTFNLTIVSKIVFDSSSSNNATSVPYLEFNHTVGTDSNRILIVGTGSRNDGGERSVSSITFNGTALTKIAHQDRGGFGNLARAELWYLLDPSPGKAIVNVTWDGVGNHALAGAISLFNVNQFTPFGKLAQAGGCAGANTLNVGTEFNNSMVVDVISYQDKGTFTAGEGQIDRWHAFTGIETAMSTENTTANGTVVMSWTPDSCLGHIAQEIRVTGTVPSMAPVVNNVLLNSTFATNFTNENLTVYWNSTDINGDGIINITDWRVNNLSIAVLNMPFEADGLLNATDYSIFGNNATIVNGSFWNRTGGRIGAAYQFDGVNDYISVPTSSSLNIRNKITVEAWINPSVINNDPYKTIFEKNNDDYLLALGAPSTGPLFYFNTDVQPHEIDSNWNIAVNTWHHVVGTYNGSVAKIYVDGVLRNQSEVTGQMFNSNQALRIGGQADDSFFNGTIDEIKIYNRSLSAQQVYANFIAGNLSRPSSVYVAEETFRGEMWQACITPNDGFTDGNTSCSNDLFVRNIINITSIYPNQTGDVQNIMSETSVAITRDSSTTTNLTFNATAIAADSEMLTFSWYINNVLKFVQNILSGMTSFFSHLFTATGTYNVTVVVNGSGHNDTFQFNLTIIGNNPPSINNIILNSTFATNFTNENLTVYWNSTDIDNEAIVNITDWRVNGASIASLNMPFENHSNSANNATDYSSFNHTGGVQGAILGKNSGYNGFGSYFFDGSNDYINVPDSNALDFTTALSFSVWVNWTGTGTNNGIVFYKEGTPTAYGLVLLTGGGNANKATFSLNLGSGWTDHYSSSTISQNVWHHIAGTFDASADQMKIYVDGTLDSTHDGLTGDIQTNAGALSIGREITQGTEYYRGWIDDLALYNRTLTPEQILLIYRNKTNIIGANETRKGERWQACITPNDGSRDGNTSCSNNLTIRNSVPTTPTLLNPNKGNDTLTILQIPFDWTASTDLDDDALTYQLNLTSQFCADQTFSSISDSNFTSPELATVDACGVYFWNVRAFDGQDYGSFSELFNLSIQSLVNITLIQNLTDFGNMQVREINDTTDNNPVPFIVQSDSNVLVNISVKALADLWTTSGLGNNSFRYKANTTNETGSFNLSRSQTSFTPVTGSFTFAIARLNFTNTNDTAAIDFEVTVPDAEPAGQKSANVVILGAQS